MANIIENEHFIKVVGHNIYAKTWNVKNCSNWVVLLHDAIGSVAQWKKFPMLLAQHLECNVMAYDRIGYGKSEGSVFPREINYMHLEANQYLSDLLNQMNIKKPLLVGHSDGGSVGLMYANDSNCVAMVSIASHVFVEDITIRGIREAGKYRTKISEALNKFHGSKSYEIFDAWNKCWLSPEFRSWNIESEIHLGDLPLLLIQGDNDEYGTWKQIDAIVNKAKSVKTEKLKGIGHMPHLENRDVLVQLIARFAEQHF